MNRNLEDFVKKNGVYNSADDSYTFTGDVPENTVELPNKLYTLTIGVNDAGVFVATEWNKGGIKTLTKQCDISKHELKELFEPIQEQAFECVKQIRKTKTNEIAKLADKAIEMLEHGYSRKEVIDYIEKHFPVELSVNQKKK